MKWPEWPKKIFLDGLKDFFAVCVILIYNVFLTALLLNRFLTSPLLFRKTHRCKHKLLAQLHLETQHSCQLGKNGDFQFAKVKTWFHLPSLVLRKCKGDPALPWLLSGRSTCIWWELDTGATRNAWPNTAIIFLTYKSNCQETGSDYTFPHSLHAAALERNSITTLSSVCTWAVCSWTLWAPKALLHQLTAHWLKKTLAMGKGADPRPSEFKVTIFKLLQEQDNMS